MGNTPSAATVATTPSAGYLPPEGSADDWTKDGEATATLFARARAWEKRRTANDAKEVAVLGGQLLARYEGRLPHDLERSSDVRTLQVLRVDPYATTMCEILRTAGSKHGPRAQLLSTVGAEPTCCTHASLQRWRRYAVKAEEATAAARTGVQRGHVALRDGPGVTAAAHALLLLRYAPPRNPNPCLHEPWSTDKPRGSFVPVPPAPCPSSHPRNATALPSTREPRRFRSCGGTLVLVRTAALATTLGSYTWRVQQCASWIQRTHVAAMTTL
jgi:hypothetical protein